MSKAQGNFDLSSITPLIEVFGSFLFVNCYKPWNESNHSWKGQISFQKILFAIQFDSEFTHSLNHSFSHHNFRRQKTLDEVIFIYEC